MEAPLERQAIRLAIQLAAASSHGVTPEVIADLRDEATHLMTLCVRTTSSSDELVRWCDDVVALIDRAVGAQALQNEHALSLTASILRFRLLASQIIAETESRTKKTSSSTATHDSTSLAPKPEPAPLTANAKQVYEHIRANPEVRTKDLIEAFGATFSTRSTKRYLAELLEKNLVQRHELDDGGMAYRPRS